MTRPRYDAALHSAVVGAMHDAAVDVPMTGDPGEVAGRLAEILADYGDDLTDADDRVEAINRMAELWAARSSAPAQADPSGADLLALAHGHRNTGCPGCDGDVAGVGVTHLTYAYERCDCDKAEYTHLTERIWHLTCLTDAAPNRESAELLDDAAHVLDRYKLGKPTAARIRAFVVSRASSLSVPPQGEAPTSSAPTGSTLVVGQEGEVLASATPEQLLEALHATGYEPNHVMRVGEDGWVLRHSLACRLSGDLFDCPVNKAAMGLNRPPAPLGDWVVEADNGRLRVVTVPEGES